MIPAIVSPESVKEDIRAVLSTVSDGDFQQAAVALLRSLGYHSERTLSGQTGDPADLIRSLAELDSGGPGLTGTQTERAFLDNAQSVRILFQFASSEIQAQAQPGMFDEAAFDMGIARSFLFAAVELNGDSYPRGQYAAFTRELNKHVQIPTVVLFRTAANRVTLAFVHRRPNRRDASRDVLGSVSLIREIDAADPHRAHLDILAELSLPERLRWMEAHGKPPNFDGLLEAWLDALDTEELNRRFYNDLFRWFERAVKDAKFPTGEARNLPAEEHAIRLITRLMFVWFIKEKGLVAGDLFIENKVAQLLKDYDPAGGDSYYRAVLQNLFFATLNTEIGQRRFSARNRDDYRSTSLYRYRKEIADEDALLALFSETPFINGGLFDCLDSFEGQQSGGYRIDCFSDVHYRKLSIPNRLFFSADDREPGLIDLFDRYKFTVEENTPAEQEVALDPELLGKVFENLLAAYNPETRENARKQTGSYYTPRAVVDYMVGEALVATLAQRAAPADGDADSWQDKLRCLLDYNDANAGELFTPDDSERIVRAIAETKALDPAVGSGAFPMGILHKLTLALSRLDPGNELWRARQIELHGQRAAGAFWTADRQERDAELQEISATFQKYGDSDFGRKLYLIQNSIYGVDIQPVATQIAKLRFFISLAIEQERDPDAPNYGIRPLPNLETRFVAANSLLGLARPQQFRLGETPAVERIKGALSVNRERHFHATTRPHKMALRRDDAELRRQLAAALRQAEFSAGDADKVANWDPYDQNASADWFDPEYMFGMTDGFDVVIANPPYVQLQKDGGHLGQLYKDAGYSTYARTGDVYQLFYEKGCQLLAPGSGILAYITSNSWLKAEYGKSTRRYFAERHTPLQLLEMGKDVFDNVIVDAGILLARQGRQDADAAPLAVAAVDTDRLAVKDFPPIRELWGQARPDGDAPWSVMSAVEQRVLDKMQAKGTPLKDWEISIYRGVLTGYNEAFIIDAATRERLIVSDPKSAEIIKPVLRGRDIQRYQAQWAGLWLIATVPSRKLDIEEYPSVKQHLLSFGKERLEQSGKTLRGGSKARKKTQHSWYELQDSIAYYEEFAKEKLFWMDMSPEGRFSYSDEEMYCNNKGFIMTGKSLKYLCAVLNSTLVTWLMNNTARTTGMGLMQWEKFAVERIPVPNLTDDEQRPFIWLVDRILEAKAADPGADTGELEDDLDWLVYSLYRLSKEERAAVGGKTEFRVVPNRGGLAPGVTPENLKDIIFEQEEQDFLEKLGL